jgi:hypothetical protein
MTASEVIGVALIVVVGVLTTAALYAGLVGMLGGLYIVRCSACDHFTFSFTPRPRSCPYCRHPMLLHPLRTIRYLGSAERAGDR